MLPKARNPRTHHEQHSQRYNNQQEHLWNQHPPANKEHLATNKENSQAGLNYQLEPRFGQFEGVKSMEFGKRLRTSGNEQQFGQFRKHNKGAKNLPEQLKESQEVFRFRQRQVTEEEEKSNGLLSSRQFLDEKRLKGQIIDQMIGNRVMLCKSLSDFSQNDCVCANHAGKKAKYRLIAELAQGEEEMFYCSKCAINLLQQNFKIEQIRNEEAEGHSNSARLAQITHLENRLKQLEERARHELDSSDFRDHLALDQELAQANSVFEEMLNALHRLRNDWVASIKAARAKKQAEERTRRDLIGETLASMRDIQHEMKQYKNMRKFAVMKENEFQFITGTLHNKIAKFEESLEQHHAPSPSRLLPAPAPDHQLLLRRLSEQLAALPHRRSREVTFSRQEAPATEDEFACDELKRPFRVLFPSEDPEQPHHGEAGLRKSSMLDSVRERTAFDRLP